jgi:hydroxymethylglutaryl-CoA lyase
VEGPVSRPALPTRVIIREVGPRDGLQAEAPLTVEDRIRFIDALSGCGFGKIEAVSFVSPKAVPAMAGAAEVWAGVEKHPEVEYSALVPNRRGAEEAVRAGGFATIQAFLAASDGYNRKNVGKSVDESMEDVRQVVAVARSAGVPVECSISAAFGDPYEGDVAPRTVVDVAARLVDAGVAAVSLGDTTGMATPSRVWDVVGLLRDRMPDVPLNLHFHDTRGTAMANVLAALEVGVTEFDASVGGLGGSPFAPGANGNLATEDVVHMLEDMGIETGVDLDAVLAAAHLADELVGHAVHGQVSKAGPRWSAGGR